MIKKILKFILTIALAILIFAAASIAGVYNDERVEKKLEEEAALAAAEAEALPKEVTSPFSPYRGGVLELQMDYEVQTVGNDLYISVLSNLPDSFNLTAELSNVEDVKKRLGYDGIASSALTNEQMNEINDRSYYKKSQNFVTNGVCTFIFNKPPAGQLDLKVTSPVTKLQPGKLQDILGEKGANFEGPYVVYLKEVDDKSINYSVSFIVEDDGTAGEEIIPVESEDGAPPEGEAPPEGGEEAPEENPETSGPN